MPWELRDGEPVIDAALVRALLAEQHPDLARLPLGEPVRGWDNTMVRLGESLALRLPRHAQAETLLDREVAWLPRLAAQLAAQLSARSVGPAEHTIPAIPTPDRTGVPGAGYPFRWALVPWVHGTPAVRLPVEARDAYAARFAATMRGLHQPAPAQAPASAVRGVGLTEVEDRFARRWDALAGDLGRERRHQLTGVWRRAVDAPPQGGPRLWLHGDPHPNNTVLTRAGPGTGEPVLVDFGDLCAGDPASDVGSALLHFSPSGRDVFAQAYDAGRAPDAALWARAHGWAVYYALIFAAQSPGEALRPLGRHLLR